jgi:DNA invertase Pin-like site-specific DNA recombinase
MRSPRALIYARVSTSEQKANGHSLAAQETACRAECERRGWDVVDVVAEDASGKSLARPQLLAALDWIASGEVDALVCSSLSRLSRNVRDFSELLDWFERAGADLVLLDAPVDTTTANGRLAARTFANAVAWEREILSERTSAALAEVRRQGKAISRAAVADDPTLVGRIRDWRLQGWTYQEIADRLNCQQVPTLRGAEQWTVSAVRTAAGWKRQPTQRRVELPKVARRR